MTVLAAVATTVVAMTGTASAHTTTIYHGSDWASNDHSHLNVHDIECDNHGVWAEAYDNIGFFTVYDNTGCGGTGVHGDGVNIYLYRLCETGEGCTAWRNG
ncbi:hypothetical protein [Saccharothrix violaceirubra]|uniref:Uncharacterized protein n=1 Tax=Saccharothrix violaceirubra TaxID=413306 RepID=A0A7W7T4M3_9PSEU|nr:hypothetical protein [Saccharothrix violaceirubra]MBB4966474.1 hypothetical protein [Saccharothrix violaceirubra]